MKPLLRALVLVFVATSCFAQDAARLDEIVQTYVQNKTFMGSVLVARGGDVVLSQGYGAANLEWNIPNTPSTKFRLGSITKQFTAASILLLEERGKLKLADPIRAYLPDAPAAWDRITIFDLLRPHRKALLLGILVAVGEGIANLLEPVPLKIVLDNVLRSKPLTGWLNHLVISHRHEVPQKG